MRKTKFSVLVLLCGLLLNLASSAAQDAISPMLEEGAYQVGVQILNLTDASRDGREVQTFVWYPALASDDAPLPYPPDSTAAPYPLIIFSHGGGGVPIDGTDLIINHLVSHGFVVAAPAHEDTAETWRAIIDRPLDALYVLNQLTEVEDSPLVGVIDTERVGVIGLSFGGYTTLAVGGARINPNYFLNFCDSDSSTSPAHYCTLTPIWDEMAAYHDRFLPASDDDLWVAATDDRIDAILPMIPCLGQLFGEAGLEAISLPTLILAGTKDPQCPIAIEGDYIYAHLGSQDKYMVSVDVPGHGQALVETVVQHYATAFFGHYLQEKSDYAQYLTPESAEQFEHVTLETPVEAE